MPIEPPEDQSSAPTMTIPEGGAAGPRVVDLASIEPEAPPDAAAPSKRRTIGERLGQALPLVGILVVIGISIANSSIHSAPHRRLADWIIGGLAAAILLGWLLFSFRKTPSVARTTAFLLMFAIVGAFGLVPVITLGTADRDLPLKLGGIAVLSLIPGLLYLQFIMVRGQTAKLEYVQNLTRLRMDREENLPAAPRGASSEGGRDTSSDNLYLQKFEGLYGKIIPEQQGGQVRIKGETLLPVVLTTVLLAVGWAVVFQPETVLGLHIFPNSIAPSGKPSLPADALRFGMAGSYFWVLQMLIRRYFQDDLKTSAYINAMARIVTVALLVTAVAAVWPSGWAANQLNAFSFLVGIFPQIALKAIQNLLLKPLRGLVPSLQRDYPLSDLDGLNIWYEARLLEEGIEDMQNLATANLVDVMLRTRVPVGRLVDWVDQAHLYLRVRGSANHDEGAHGSPSDRDVLRRLGIRTATDLEDEFAPTAENGDKLSRRQLHRIERLRWVLNPGKKDDGQPSITESVLTSLQREPNLFHVRCWKSSSPFPPAPPAGG